MRHTLAALLALTLTLAACAPDIPAAPTATVAPTATSAPTTTEAPTATATEAPTPTQESLPSRWDDPELLAGLKSDFETKMGMSVEDYYNKAKADGVIIGGESRSCFSGRWKYVDASLTAINVGSRMVETPDGVKHLVLYGVRESSNGVVVYPVDVGFEGKEGFVQTSMDALNDTTARNPFMYDNPLTYTSMEEVKSELDQLIGTKISLIILVRFRDIDDCSLPQNTTHGNVPAEYWNYIGSLCRTSGNYINTESQEPVVNYGDCELAQSYSLDHFMEEGIPESGLIPVMIGLRITSQ